MLKSVFEPVALRSARATPGFNPDVGGNDNRDNFIVTYLVSNPSHGRTGVSVPRLSLDAGSKNGDVTEEMNHYPSHASLAPEAT
jgi:hypothetical protein